MDRIFKLVFRSFHVNWPLLYFVSFFGVNKSSAAVVFLEEPNRQPIPPSFLTSPSYDQQNLYYPELSSRLFEGDILDPPHSDSRNAINIDMYKWPNGIVPYEFNSTFDDQEEQKKVRDAMDALEKNTCIKFIIREEQTEYISINREKGKGCFAMIGYRPKLGKALPVNLQSPECLRHSGTIQHELLHVLGLLHEQARPDRDNYVEIVWNNVDPLLFVGCGDGHARWARSVASYLLKRLGLWFAPARHIHAAAGSERVKKNLRKYKSDFGKARKSEVTTFDVPYDYLSVMHYPKYAFSKNGKNTIVAVGAQRDESVNMGQRDGATDGDLEKVRKMYKCPSSYKN